METMAVLLQPMPKESGFVMCPIDGHECAKKKCLENKGPVQPCMSDVGRVVKKIKEQGNRYLALDETQGRQFLHDTLDIEARKWNIDPNQLVQWVKFLL